MTDASAFIRNGRLDLLATNRLDKALYWPLFQDPQPQPSCATRPNRTRTIATSVT
ncbi:hypothetical protein ACF08O_25815 [Streptomyces paradoxus]|uniref:hypothetical protein n=1 Tax=Streptomyces paradoxus TaxID=66375 RepID=UPI0036FE0B53